MSRKVVFVEPAEVPCHVRSHDNVLQTIDYSLEGLACGAVFGYAVGGWMVWQGAREVGDGSRKGGCEESMNSGILL